MKRKNNNVLASRSNRVAGKIAAGILWVQSKWASLMSRIWQKLSARGRIAVFCLCCLLMGAYSSILIATAFKKPARLLDAPVKIKIPEGIIDRRPLLPVVRSPDLPAPVIKYHVFMDSLERTPAGRRTKDSLIGSRPGLVDSIRKIEMMFKQLPK